MSKALLLLGFVLFLSGPLAASSSSDLSGSVSLPANPGSTTAVEPPGHSLEDLIEEILRRYDTNGDGKLDPAERHRLLWDILRDQDPSQPAVIDEESFVRWLRSMGYNENTARNLWRMLLQEADRNGDGVIDIREWTEFLRRHGLILIYVLVPVNPDQIDPGSVYPAELFPYGQDGQLFDGSDFLLLAPKAPIQP